MCVFITSERTWQAFHCLKTKITSEATFVWFFICFFNLSVYLLNPSVLFSREFLENQGRSSPSISNIINVLLCRHVSGCSHLLFQQCNSIFWLAELSLCYFYLHASFVNLFSICFWIVPAVCWLHSKFEKHFNSCSAFPT